MAGKLPLQDGVRTRVFREIVRLLQTDVNLKRIIKPTSWNVWTGSPDDKSSAFAVAELPAIRITPALGASPETNVRQNSPMGLHFELATDGLNIDDAFNLWEAVEAVLFVGQGTNPVLAALQKVAPGAVFNLKLSSPAYTPISGGELRDTILTEGDLTLDMLVKK